ncbi:hypothetical protein R70723_26130 [Paenibacillus sp. FSL R7-0273]|uniref:YdcF family protein n=1 Tax=Paenibacillus sp. FSL R7-0273 TaxID=1536772 RepID=UPI0004F8F0BD|nr:YdcF family protein [Paenibacillus sp. FSL R7-0273]AIQ48994.1 hypothetical protein R70723_26130 [Paenibacillus sp. FSL R7-0273]OMF90549.1 hypothetical protein BK144_17195 [Paenibacillus sp. FSL R7-0273]
MKKFSFKFKPGKYRKKIIFLYLPMLLLVAFLLFAGRFLVLSQAPQKADVIIVLSGGAGRVEKAAEIYNEGYASEVILTNVNGFAGPLGNLLNTAIANNISEIDIISEESARSTYENAVFTLAIMQEKKYTSAIVVSSNFHMRRTKFNFDNIYKNSDIQLTYVSSPTNFNASRWWSNQYSRGLIFEEYSKMLGNFLGYNGPEAKKILYQVKKWFDI